MNRSSHWALKVFCPLLFVNVQTEIASVNSHWYESSLIPREFIQCMKIYIYKATWRLSCLGSENGMRCRWNAKRDESTFGKDKCQAAMPLGDFPYSPSTEGRRCIHMIEHGPLHFRILELKHKPCELTFWQQDASTSTVSQSSHSHESCLSDPPAWLDILPSTSSQQPHTATLWESSRSHSACYERETACSSLLTPCLAPL